MECLTSATSACGGGPAGNLMLHLLSTLFTAQCTLNDRSTYPKDMFGSHLQTYDFIVVGAGSAGAAVAGRLSENSQWTVLLIEAGDDPNLESNIPGLMFTVQNSDANWNFKTEPQKHSSRGMVDKRSTWPRGKALGGTSIMNGMLYLQGNEKDYDDWEAAGNTGWGWNSVKKYFDRFVNENKLQQSEVESKTDLQSITRKVILEASKELGFDVLTQQEDVLKGSIGYLNTYKSIKKGIRSNTAKLFLSPAKKRANFHVIKNGRVGKIIIDEATKKTKGVSVFVDSKWVTINVNKEVILSAGTVNTPQILMLSGIGPKEHLIKHNIPVIADLPVGRNLQDHLVLPAVFHSVFKSNKTDEFAGLDAIYEYFVRRTGPLSFDNVALHTVGFANTKSDSKYPNVQFHHFYTDSNDKLGVPLFFETQNFLPEIIQSILEKAKKSNVLMQIPTLAKPKSRGTISLKSKDPFEAPVIDPNYLSESEDVEVLLDGIKHCLKMGETEAFRRAEAELLQISTPGCDDLKFNTNEYWTCVIRNLAATVYHPVGTAKMGTGPDAVVDPRLKVHGIRGLRVADGSIMPDIVTVNTNGPIIMIGEKAADLIKEDWIEQQKRSDL